MSQEKRLFNVMLVVQLYLLATFLFYFIGPVRWLTKNSFFLITFVLLYQSSMMAGYWFYSKIKHNNVSVGRDKKSNLIVKYFYLFAGVALIVNVLYFTRIVLIVLQTSSISSIIELLTNPSLIYSSLINNNLSSSEMFGGKVLSLIILVTGPITTGLIPLTIFYFERLSTNSRFMAVLAILSQIGLSVSVGTSEGYFNLIIYFMAGLFLLMAKKGKIRINIRTIIFLLSFALLGVYILSLIQLDRNQGSYSLPLGENVITINSFLQKMPQAIIDSVVYLHAYITQGYYGMSISLGLAWTPTFGLGFSPYILLNIQELLNHDMMSMTFMGKAEQFGWRELANWHTAYTWFANDIHWIGVIPLMFFLGYLFSKSYTDAVNHDNPNAIVIFTLLLMLFIFLPANNKVFAAPQTFFSFFIYLFLYIIFPSFYRKPRFKYEL